MEYLGRAWTNYCCKCDDNKHLEKNQKLFSRLVDEYLNVEIIIHKEHLRKIKCTDYNDNQIIVRDIVFEIVGDGFYYFYVNAVFRIVEKWHSELVDANPWVIKITDPDACIIDTDSDSDDYYDFNIREKKRISPEYVLEEYDLYSNFQFWVATLKSDASLERLVDICELKTPVDVICFLFCVTKGFPNDFFDSGK